MASRFGHRDTSRSSLFSSYDARTTTNNNSRPKSSSPSRRSLYGPSSSFTTTTTTANPYAASQRPRPNSTLPPGYSAYPSSGATNNNNSSASASSGFLGAGEGGAQQGQPGFRAATPNRRGQYSDAVLSELESQNDEQLEGMSAKVRMLKDMTVAIGGEIISSTALAESMNNSFENTQTRLRGTMKRMLRMADRTGVGWKVWLLFFAAVVVLFWYVRLF